MGVQRHTHHVDRQERFTMLMQDVSKFRDGYRNDIRETTSQHRRSIKILCECQE